MYVWKPVPDSAPGSCHFSGLSGHEHGPYLEGPKYTTWEGGYEVEHTLWISATGLRAIFRNEGSPFVDPWNEVTELRAQGEEKDRQIEDLKGWVEEHEAEVKKLKSKNIDNKLVASLIAEQLKEEIEEKDLKVQRKPGRKKKS